MRIKQFAALAMCAALAAGCANTTGGDAKVSQSGFHQAAVVKIDPHGTGMMNGLSMQVITIGAQWQQQNPNTAVVLAGVYGEIIGVTGAALNIDGEIVDLKPIPGLTRFEGSGMQAQSLRTFNTSVDTIRKLAGAKRVWIKLNTTKGWMEDGIIDGEKDSKAYHAMRRFVAAVDKELAK